MNSLRFTRVRHRDLSLWQSAVAENVRNYLANNQQSAGARDVLAHPMSVAAAHHVEQAFADPTFKPSEPASRTGPETQVYLSHLGHQIGEAMATNNKELADALGVQYRKFSDEDTLGFLSCAVTYAQYKLSSGNTMTYHDWTKEGRNDINYGLIGWKLPNNAKVGILGDWGTGLPDAIALLKDMMVQHKPDAIIHLGDIYYSGTPDECRAYFSDVFKQVFDEVLGPGNRIPVFSIPGNHDYYAWGAEYYNVVADLNNYSGGTSAIQPASYFCLRTEDGGWQLLGMDTGYNDSNPADQLNPLYAGPWLQDSEIAWHRDKMQNFGGTTILLSHHQLFSSNSAINGRESEMNVAPYFNPYLYRVFFDYLPTKVAGWIWGHEHNFVMYQNYLCGLGKGRLIGNSAYEELTASDPYKINYPAIPYLVPGPDYDKYKLGTNADSNGVMYYNHGYAIIDFSGRVTPTAPVQVSYYQFPAWGDMKPADAQSSLMYQEPFAPPATFEYGMKIVSGTINYYLNSQDGMAVQPAYAGSFGYYYPNLLPSNADSRVLFTITKIANGVSQPGVPVQDGDVVALNSTEVPLNNSGVPALTAGSIPWLYYSSPTSGSFWRIHKRDKGGDPTIHTFDPVYFENMSYTGQYLKPVYSKKYSLVYLTTEANPDFFWYLRTME